MTTGMVRVPVLVESTTNTAPVLTPTQIVVAPGEGATSADLAAMTRDADSDPLVFTAGAAPEGFSTSVSGSTLSVIPVLILLVLMGRKLVESLNFSGIK